MFVKPRGSCAFFSFFLICSSFAISLHVQAYGQLSVSESRFDGTIEKSIVPHIDHFESIEALSKAKYSSIQYREIERALNLKNQKIRIVSYNILFNRYDHQLAKENRWPQRFPRVSRLIEGMNPDILAIQELYLSQAKDLIPVMQEKYDFFSKKSQEGEINGIFYRKDRFELIDGFVWSMTKTPLEPSQETLTMVKLKDKLTGKSVAVFNVHLAFTKIEKRDFQARFISEHIESFAQGLPIILLGDMNTFPHRLDLEKLPFYDGDYVHRLLTKNTLKDARDRALLGHLGPLSTFSNADEEAIAFTGTGTPGVFLDHIYTCSGIDVLIHAVEPAVVNGHYPSDHLPVIIDFLII